MTSLRIPPLKEKATMRPVLLALVVLILSAQASSVFSDRANFASGAQGAPAQTQKPEIPLLGLDPLLLIQGKEVQGDLNISTIRGQYKYLFASAENKARFEQSPERYEIQLEGACGREGAPNRVREPEIYSVYKDRIYVFHSFECQKAFAAAPERFFETTPPKINASPESARKGSWLIEKAVADMGGAALIDALKTYQEAGTTAEMMGGPDGMKARDIRYTTTIVFPGQIRKEQTTSFGSQIFVIVPGDGFVLAQNRLFSMIPATRGTREKEIKLKLLSILRARNNAGFKAIAVEPKALGATTLEQLVEFDGLTLNLGVEPASGRIVRFAYRGRGPNYDFGEIVQTFSDFRKVEGVTLPFKISGTFNGQPEPTQSWVIESIKINEKFDPAMFERPKPPVRQ
jgi:YHS domain-containing protein